MNALTVSGRPSSDTEGIPSVITDREWPALRSLVMQVNILIIDMAWRRLLIQLIN